jgi:hypothetical protein
VVISRVDQQPVGLPVTDPMTGQPIQLNRVMLVLGIHSALMNTRGAAQLPRLIHQAYEGNWNEIAELYARDLSDSAANSKWLVMNLTIVSYEDRARLDPAETAQFSPGAYL